MNSTESFGHVFINNYTNGNFTNNTYDNFTKDNIVKNDDNNPSLLTEILCYMFVTFLILFMTTIIGLFIYAMINDYYENKHISRNYQTRISYDSDGFPNSSDSESSIDLEEGKIVVEKRKKKINYKIAESNLDIVSINSQTTCAICIEPILRSQKICVLDCEHMYHQDCVSDWFNATHINKFTTCPICRSDMEKITLEIHTI